MDAELVIEGVDVVDDHGARRADVAVSGGVIAAVGPNLPIGSAAERLDGRGRMLCPGFIDLHGHSALRAFDEPLLEPKIAQGFTTELICPDGLGPAPVTPALAPGRRTYLQALEPSTSAPWDWASMDDFLAALEAAGPASSMVTAVPHSAVREVVMGGDDRRPDAGELVAMQELARRCFDAGARAMSFGLIYAPGLYADTAELVAMAEVAAAYDAPLVPHVRNEARGVLDSIDEFVRVAERTGAPLHVSHVKLVGCPDLLTDLVDLLLRAEDRVRLTFDQYPYGAGSTLLAALLPPYAFAGGPAAILARVADATERTRMVRDMDRGLTGWENLYGACGPDHIVITQAGGRRSDAVGQTLEQVADRAGTDPAVAVLDLLRDTSLDVAMIDHYSTEAVVREIFTLPRTLVGSDGVFNPHPHPRLYGTAARVLGRYAMRERLVPVEEAVARLTSRPARLLGLADRGRVAEGLRADLVLLDPTEFVDRATYDDPHQTPSGVELVLVAGRPVWRDGKATGERPGTVCRSTA
ncbi:MAG TPA: D-aminoacylase [Actinomycetes bacterium]|nr:D-aminoacylase [Actinomycetes bacterium]